MPKPVHTASTKFPPNRPTVAVLGLGQMGLVCTAVLTSSDPSQPQRASETTGVSKETPAEKFVIQRPVNVLIWGNSQEELGRLDQSRRSPRLEHFVVPDEVRMCRRDADLASADVIVSAIPVQYTREVWTRIAPHVSPRAKVVSVAKGIEVETLLRPTQIIGEALRSTGRDNPDAPARPLGCLSGPTIASELARCLPAAMIAASDDAEFAQQIQTLFTTSWLRVYTNTDLLGVELAGAVKNVIAIAAGIVDGLQAGNNAKSALLARGLAEIARLGIAMGASPDTFFGIAGVGDLATTCFSPEGRNRSCGEAIGKGVQLDDYLAQSQFVVEGVATARSVVGLARKYRVDMPIVQGVYAVLFENMDPIDAIGKLMTREPKAERVG